MKTKTKSRTKILFVLAVFFCCFVSLNSFGQNTFIPTQQDFHGTWTGVTPDGNTVEIKLNPNSSCEFKVSGVPIHPANPVTGYRLPQYAPKFVEQNGSPSAPEIFIKFYTRNAISGIRASAPASSTNSSAVTDNSVEQVYSGIAVISQNASGQSEMKLYLDVNNFSSTAPVL